MRGQVADRIKIACVGASLTFGLGLPERRAQAYPAVLGRLLGDRYLVRNFGYSGATAGRKTNEPYWDTPSFLAATRFEPMLAVISLGVNDAQHANAPNLPSFEADLTALAEHFRLLDSRPQVLLMTPPPVFPPTPEIDLQALENTIRPAIQNAADLLGFPLVDGYSALADRPELFPDNLHPSAEGAAILARTVHAAVQELA